LLAFAVRVALIFVLGSPRLAEGSEVINVAVSLAKTGHFSDAYGPGTGPTAHVAPVYPFLLSLIYRVLGTGLAGEIGKEVFSSALAALSCSLLPALALAFGWDFRVGLWAGIWAALFPINFYPETKGTFESAFTGVSLVLICLYAAEVWRYGKLSPWFAITGGALAGIAVLASPSVAPVIALLLVMGAWTFRQRMRAFPLYAALLMGVAALVLIPWMLRNELVLGSPIFVRSNLGLELMLSNNDLASPDYQTNFVHGLFGRYHPFANFDAQAEEIRLGEAGFQRERMEQAKSWIVSHPARFAQLTLERVGLFWFPPMARISQTIWMGLQALLGIAGFILLWLKTKNIARWIIAAVWLGYPFVYYFVQTYTRYRYPVEWTFVLLGSYAVWTFSVGRSSDGLAV
jgi:MFS family permease